MNAAPTPFRRPRRRGFTVVEVLVAIAVLAIVGLIITQIISMITQGTKISTSSVDAASQARLVLDRIGLDVQSMVKRSDVDFRINDDIYDTSETGRVPMMSFLAQVSSPNTDDLAAGDTNRGISLISYTVEPMEANGDRLCLVRASKAIGWQMAGFVGQDANGLPIAFRDPDASVEYPVEIVKDDADILSPSVIHAVVGVQLYPDYESVYFPDDKTPTLDSSQGEIVYEMPMRGPATVLDSLGNEVENPAGEFPDLNRVASLVVGVVVVDLESLVLLTEDGAEQLAAAFAVTPAVDELPVAKWMDHTDNLSIDDLATKCPDVPLPVLRSVRVYQRFYPVNPYGSLSQ